MKDYIEIRDEIEAETGREATVNEIQERQIDEMSVEIDHLFERDFLST